MLARFVKFDGQYEEGVLGTFRIIRGFAKLQDLAEVSVPYEMESGELQGRVKGLQRKREDHHAEEIKKYLEQGHQRFIPEVILSIREIPTVDFDLDQDLSKIDATSKGNEGIEIKRPFKSKNVHMLRVTVDRRYLESIRAKKLIRRVDGNHRLAFRWFFQDEH